MTKEQFLARIDRNAHGHFGWQEHESAAWRGDTTWRTTTSGGCDQDGPDISHRLHVETARLPSKSKATNFGGEWPWWAWKVDVTSSGVEYRARGYAESKEKGMAAAEHALHRLALVLYEQHHENKSAL